MAIHITLVCVEKKEHGHTQNYLYMWRRKYMAKKEHGHTYNYLYMWRREDMAILITTCVCGEERTWPYT